MFMATPWKPAGRPNRNSWRMIFQSGRKLMLRLSATTHRPENNAHVAYTVMIPPAITVPMAAPAVPKAGIGPNPTMRVTFSTMLRTVITIPRRRGVRASPAERSAPPSMKNTSIPRLNTNMIRRYGSASACTSGAALTTSSSVGARK